MELPPRAQVVIIGGGSIGCSIAYHLAHLGWSDVVLLERDQLTSGTTWHAAGLITSAGMASESLLWMSRYSRDLYAGLEQETGHSTGFRAIGHISLACTPARLEALRREAAFAHGFGVEDVELSPTEVSSMWPLLDTSDVLAGFYVADEGRADPVGVATSLAKGATALGVRVVQGVRVGRATTDGRRVTGVDTDSGHIEAEIVVNAAGMWARQLAARNGVAVPNQAAEHYYLITDAVEGMDPDLAVIEDPDRYGYYRPEGDGMLVGLFEPVGAPWSLDGVPEDASFTTLPPDWDRLERWLGPAIARIPALADIGIRMLFCGPESFTPDVMPLLGPAPELDGYWVAAGLNSLGILLGGGVGKVVAHWLVDGVPPVDVTGLSVDRAAVFQTSRRFRKERTVEQLGVLFGDALWPSWRPSSARGVRRSVLHDRWLERGASMAESVGWEYPEWFSSDGPLPRARPDFSRQDSFGLVVGEHRTVREEVGLMDLSLMAKFLVQGQSAGIVLDRLSTAAVAREVGRVVYTQWLDKAGGIAADLTVTRLHEECFLVVASDVIHRRVEAMIRRQVREGEFLTVTDITSGVTLLSLQGPASRALLTAVAEADLSDSGFPYMSARQIQVGYAPVTALRVTYVGELGWELHVPSEYAQAVYEILFAAGGQFGLRPVGLAAMEGLRLEKGYRDMGTDIDNTDTPLTAGLGFTVAWDKAAGFVGREPLLEQKKAGSPADRLVSLVVDDPTLDLFGNEPLLKDGAWVGYVRAAAFGHTVGGPVGLAQVHGESGVDRAWLGAGGFEVWTPRGAVDARLQLTPPYDPERKRILG